MLSFSSYHYKWFSLLKFTFSKKATKIDEIFTVDLKLCSKCQIDGEDFVNCCGLLGKHEHYLRFFLERIRKTLKILIWLDILIDASYLWTEFSNTVHKIQKVVKRNETLTCFNWPCPDWGISGYFGKVVTLYYLHYIRLLFLRKAS